MKKIAGILIIGLLSACAGQTTQPEVDDQSIGGYDSSSDSGADSSAYGSGHWFLSIERPQQYFVAAQCLF